MASKSKTQQISIIIPTLNEEKSIGRLLKHLLDNTKGLIAEIIVVDGGSSDHTVEVAKGFGVKIVAAELKGRGVQMNLGGKMSSGKILYFLHADTFPPPHFDKMIVRSISSHKFWGTFRIQFDYRHWLLGLIAWCTRFNFSFFMFGDQSLFVTKELFDDVGGFDPDKLVFEDTDIARRLRSWSKGKKIRKAPVITSARKFRENGVYRLTFVFLILLIRYLLGTSHDKLLSIYRTWIRQGKV